MTDLQERLSALDITVAVGDNEDFTVFTTVEPLFCFTCSNIEEVQELVQDTLSSYAKAFYQVENVRVILQSEEAIPVKNLRAAQYFQALLENSTYEEAIPA